MSPDALNLIPLIYDSVEAPAAWKPFLDAFAARMRARLALLCLLNPRHPGVAVTIAGGPGGSEQVQREWRERWAHLDPWVSGKDMTSYGLGRVVPSQCLCPDEQLESTEVYKQFLGPNGFHYGGGVMLALGSGLMSVLTINRPKHLGALDDGEIAFWQSLVPHLMRAVQLQAQLHETRVERDAFQASFESDTAGQALLNSAGIVLRRNGLADAILSSNDGLLLTEGGLLQASDPVLTEELAESIRAVGYPGPGEKAPARSMIIPRRERPRPLLLSIEPLHPGSEAAAGPSQPTVKVRITDQA